MDRTKITESLALALAAAAWLGCSGERAAPETASLPATGGDDTELVEEPAAPLGPEPGAGDVAPACPSTSAPCDGRCTALTESAHCGECGHRCKDRVRGATCGALPGGVLGVCVDVQSFPASASVGETCRSLCGGACRDVGFAEASACAGSGACATFGAGADTLVRGFACDAQLPTAEQGADGRDLRLAGVRCACAER
jgi:hypothetical protein